MDKTKNPGTITPRKLAVLGTAFAIILVMIALFFISQTPIPPEPSEPLIIATGQPDLSVLTLIAYENGYFEKYGLNVTLIPTLVGSEAVKMLLAGDADLAYAAEYVGVRKSFDSPNLRIIASTMKADITSIIVRNDRGISVPADLKGKTVALYKGTISDYFFRKFLDANGIESSEVTLVYLPPEEIVESIISGNVDAAVIWQPFTYQTEQQFAGNSTTWSAQGGQHYYRVTFTREDIISDRPEVFRQYLRAIDDAETFLYSHEPEAKEIVRKYVNTTDEYLNMTWGADWFVLSLDQGLIPAMEDEARWMAEQNMTGGKTPPSYLDMIYQDPMREVKPSAVTVIQ